MPLVLIHTSTFDTMVELQEVIVIQENILVHVKTKSHKHFQSRGTLDWPGVHCCADICPTSFSVD